jgi:hypothetical protein
MSVQTSHSASHSPQAVESAGSLLRNLIDYAGLFPPASLDMARSVENYDAYLRSEWNWILGRFIVPAERLGEFEEALARLPAPAGDKVAKWRLSVLLSSDPMAEGARIQQFNLQMAKTGSLRLASIESLEVKIGNVEEIHRISAGVPGDLEAYFEIPLSGLADSIAAISDCGRRAKIRTGGETPDKFPSCASVLEFMRLCASHKVPFKATAGLHHPLRSSHPLTYQPKSDSGLMHGFLNVFLAAGFLRTGMEAGLAIPMLEEQSAQAFHFDRDGVTWRQFRLSRQEIAATRKEFAISFGSCSFTEPIEDLQSLHLL